MFAALPTTYELMLEFARATSVEDVHRVLLGRVRKFGVTSVLAGIIPNRIVKPTEQPGFVVLGHWPIGWAERYFERQYVRRDLTIRHAATQSEPLVWSELHYPDNDNSARRIMDEASEFHLAEGITIPQLTLDGLRIGVSFSGDQIDRSPEAITIMTVLATYSVSRALEIHAATFAEPVHLAHREREALLWVSEGKTVADAAELMAIGIKAVEKYLSAARGKLNSLTTPQAVAQALRLGIIS